jgi:hypothetical protein
VRIDVEGRECRIVVDGIAHKPRKIVVDPKGWWLLKANVSGER